MKQIKFIFLLIFMGGLISCGQKKDTEIAEENDNIEMQVPQFSDKNLQRYADEYDAYVEEFIDMHANKAFESDEGKEKFEKFKENFEKYHFKMKKTLEGTLEEKELQKFDEYFKHKQNQMKQKTGIVIFE